MIAVVAPTACMAAERIPEPVASLATRSAAKRSPVPARSPVSRGLRNLKRQPSETSRVSSCPRGVSSRRHPVTSTCLIRSEEHTSELQSLMRISSAVFCVNKKHPQTNITQTQVETHIQNHHSDYAHQL